MTQTFELRPDRSLLNPNFDGYKLSLEKIPILKKELENSVDRNFPNSEQYSLLHAKLFALHNHLFTDHSGNAVYFIDKLWNVQKVSINQATGRFNNIQKVWQIPQCEKNSRSYNVSLHFTSESLAVLSDGVGTLHVVKTGNRSNTSTWEKIFSDQVLDMDKNFIIQDSVCTKNNTDQCEIHCLLIYIDRIQESDKFSTIINWITLAENSESQWNQISLKVLQATCGFDYCALEPNCKFIYVASDKQFKFTLDSDNPITDKPESNKIYTWTQAENNITIKINVEENCVQSDFTVNVQDSKIQVKYKSTILLDGKLAHCVDSNLTTRVIDEKQLEIILFKSESRLMWEELIPGDETGEQIFDSSVVAEIHQKLAHLCSETEVVPAESGPTFSSNQIEECDFEGENTAIFERISVSTHDVTHRINLGSHQVIMSVKLDANSPSALVVRHDVDACLWSPREQDGQWLLKHEGTLLAFGYVQASKQQRKFSSCSPDLNYSVVCESSRHVFIYHQNKDVTSGELRNRKSGHRIGTIAEQQVVSMGDDEILGLSATNEILYLLTENYILALKINCTEE